MLFRLGSINQDFRIRLLVVCVFVDVDLVSLEVLEVGEGRHEVFLLTVLPPKMWTFPHSGKMALQAI